MAMGCFAGCGSGSGSSSGSDSKVSSSDEKAFVESYLKATYDEPDGYVHYTSTAPAGAIEAAKASGEWDKKVNEYTGHFFMDSTGSRYIPESVEKVADISAEEISYAETYFEEEYHQKVKVNSGSVYYTV